MSKQYSTASTKLDYKKLARRYALETIKLQKELNEERSEINRLKEALHKSEKFPYMEPAK